MSMVVMPIAKDLDQMRCEEDDGTEQSDMV